MLFLSSSAILFTPVFPILFEEISKYFIVSFDSIASRTAFTDDPKNFCSFPDITSFVMTGMDLIAWHRASMSACLSFEKQFAAVNEVRFRHEFDKKLKNLWSTGLFVQTSSVNALAEMLVNDEKNISHSLNETPWSANPKVIPLFQL